MFSQNVSSTSTIENDISTTKNIYTTYTKSLPLICINDISPDDKNSCLDFYRWGLCGEDWMKNNCCLTCGYLSCLGICYNGMVNNIPSEYYPNPFNCSSNIPSPSDADDKPTCIQHKEWDNCDDWYMYGYCCLSCPQACGCNTNTNDNNHNNNKSIISTQVSIPTHHSNCTTDIAPPDPDGLEITCLQQYIWHNCDKSWMKGYCCLTCGYASCLGTKFHFCINLKISEFAMQSLFMYKYICKHYRFMLEWIS